MERTSTNLRRSIPAASLIATTCIAMIAFSVGCNSSALRDLPFLRSTVAETSFESATQSDSAGLTIWHDSFEDAKESSLESGKPILTAFTGSDWCPPCKKLKKEVFDSPEFSKWARENVVLLELDYPTRSMQSPEIRQQNAKLQKDYAVTGYPTVLFLEPEGAVKGKLGFMDSKDKWIEAADSILAR